MTRNTYSSGRSRSRPASRALATMAVAMVVAAIPVPGLALEEPRKAGAGFVEVGRVPLIGAPELDETKTTVSGWLILNPATRRGYQVFEGRYPEPGRGLVNRTILQSFDLDTLKPRRRAVLAGVPVTSGAATAVSTSGTLTSGEVVHAVDPAGRLYLALSQPDLERQGAMLLTVGNAPDGRRPLSRFVAIDEHEFDRCAGEPDCEWVSSFREPADQGKLRNYWIAGLAVSRHRTTDGIGRLLALFASPQPGGTANQAPLYDHTLAQWDPAGLDFSDPADAYLTDPVLAGLGSTAGEQHPLTETVDAAGPVGTSARRLDVCATAPLASSGAYQNGNYQWGILVAAGSVWTACQAGEGAGAVVRTDLDADGNLSAVPGSQEAYRLSVLVSDVFADTGGGRLLVRAFSGGQGGHTWWVFDARLRRATGAIAAKCSDAYPMAAGLDQGTGRLYQLLPDYECSDASGRTVPVRGGFHYSDTRLDPAPALENVRPDLAYPAIFRIQVDPVRRRIWLRRGSAAYVQSHVYPDLDDTAAYAPPELFYRVIEDRNPVTSPPPPADDSIFTTDVAEDPALTRASYLGSASGYGSRALLVGGFDAATNRNVFSQSPCGKDDREVLAGSVGGVEISDLSASAAAASLDADGRSQDHFREPVHRCTPADMSEGTPEWAETDEAAFGEPGEEGVNRYAAECSGDDGKREATAPSESTHPRGPDELEAHAPSGPRDRLVPRQNFKAAVTCEHGHGRAAGSSTGSFSAAQLDAAQDGAAKGDNRVPREHVTVGHAESKVTVAREAGRGIVITVDSLARDVVIPGVGTVGLVRGEATVSANGRPGGARATYRRTVCDVHIGPLHQPACRDETEQDNLERQVNAVLGTRGRVRFRDPEPTLLAGSRSGYKAGVQRPLLDGFEDTRIGRDASLAVAGMELVLYNGDSGQQGTGRQFFHFAGVQAGASYGIACLYGQRTDGRCASLDDRNPAGGGGGSPTVGPGGTEVVTVTEYLPGQPTAARTRPQGRPGLIERIVRTPFEVAADVLRLLFANPREFGLMAAVWALLYAPCYLGERRRSIRNLRARRAALGGAT